MKMFLRTLARMFRTSSHKSQVSFPLGSAVCCWLAAADPAVWGRPGPGCCGLVVLMHQFKVAGGSISHLPPNPGRLWRSCYLLRPGVCFRNGARKTRRRAADPSLSPPPTPTPLPPRSHPHPMCLCLSRHVRLISWI